MKQGMKSELCWVTMVTSITMKLSTMHMHQRRPAASSQDWCQQQPASECCATTVKHETVGQPRSGFTCFSPIAVAGVHAQAHHEQHQPQRRLASQRSSCARGKSRPVEAPCAPLPPSGFEPVAFAARGKRLRHRAMCRSRFCWPANWRDISTCLVLHCSAHAEAATFGQLGLQLENGLVEIFLSMCGTLVLASCGLGERCQRAGCVAVAVLLAEWRARGSCITTRLHLNLPQS